MWGLIALLLVALFQMFQPAGNDPRTNEIAYSSFLEAVEKNRVQAVTIQGDRVTGTYTDQSVGFSTYAPSDPDLVNRLEAQGVQITAKPLTDGRSTFTGMFLNWLPLLLLIGVWIFIMRQMQSGQGKAMGFGKSKAKLMTQIEGKRDLRRCGRRRRSQGRPDRDRRLPARSRRSSSASAARCPTACCSSALPAPVRR